MLFSFILLCQVYIIKVSWSDGSTEAIYRRYSKFFDLQVSEPLTVCVCVVIFEFLLIVLNVFFHFCRFGGLFFCFVLADKCTGQERHGSTVSVIQD